ncbi:MAG: hypothetical protein ABA06_02510 [Parcubacteria bacterium C7867-001]|nr:MAG: hypothetical protein ABA06_02510 [Parcubacteria bacterium C7867-001]
MNDSVIDKIVAASRPVRYAATAALGLLAVFLLVISLNAISDFGRSNIPYSNTITVSGTGKSAAVPNIAHISFSVTESAATVADAQAAATKKANAALEFVKSQDIDDKDVQASGYNVYPKYETQNCSPGVYCIQQSSKIIGYEVTESIEVKVRDTAKAGEVLAGLGKLGVQNISGPNFTVDDTSEVTAEARGKAIEDAREKAEKLAKQLGVRLGKVVAFSENGGGYPMMYGYGKGGVAMDAAVEAAPNLPVGQNETNVSVSITYEIR